MPLASPLAPIEELFALSGLEMEDVKKSQDAQHEDAAPDFRNMKMLLEERRTCCGATVIGMQNFREPQRLLPAPWCSSHLRATAPFECQKMKTCFARVLTAPCETRLARRHLIWLSSAKTPRPSSYWSRPNRRKLVPDVDIHIRVLTPLLRVLLHRSDR